MFLCSLIKRYIFKHNQNIGGKLMTNSAHFIIYTPIFISLRCSSNSEVNASELLEKLEEIFSRYRMQNDLFSMFKSHNSYSRYTITGI